MANFNMNKPADRYELREAERAVESGQSDNWKKVALTLATQLRYLEGENDFR